MSAKIGLVSIPSNTSAPASRSKFRTIGSGPWPHLMILPSLAPTRTTTVARNAVGGPSAPASHPIRRLLPPSPWEPPATAARPGPLIGPGPAAPEAAGPRSPLWRLANGDALARRAPSDTLPVPPAWAVTWQHRHWSTPPRPFSHPESSQAAAPQRYVRSGPGTHYPRANGERCTQSQFRRPNVRVRRVRAKDRRRIRYPELIEIASCGCLSSGRRLSR